MEAIRDRFWTYEEYLKLPDDGKRYEIIDGVLYVSPSPRTAHQMLVGSLHLALSHLQAAGQGFALVAPLDVCMPGTDPVQPDLMFIGADQRSILKRKHIEGVPTLLVEVLSPTSARLDRVIKLNKYASCGVPHYWIGDPRQRTLEILRLRGANYDVLAALGPGDRFEHPDFPGLTLDIDALFATLPPELEEED